MTIAIIDFLIVAVLLTADLLTKHAAASYLPAHGGFYEAIPKVLTFRYSENTGAAFGIFNNSRVFLSVFVAVILVGLIAFMTYHVLKKKHKEKGGTFLHVALSMILAGGIGNLVDRIALGYVRDFIEYTVVYTLFKKDFAICNLADVFLTIGVIMVVIYLVYSMVVEIRKEKNAKRVSDAQAETPDLSLSQKSDPSDALTEREEKGEGDRDA